MQLKNKVSSNLSCRKSSILDCINCESYECKNLYGPIKQNSRSYRLIKDKFFDECIIGCENCEHLNKCSCLVRENVALMD